MIALLFVIGLVLFASNLGGRYGMLHQVTMELVGPVQKGFTKLSSGIEVLWQDYLALINVRQENRRLKALLETYDRKLAHYREAYATYLHLEEELAFREMVDFPPLTARVIGRDPSFWFQTIIVDRGENDGVIEGMVALNAKGIVGQVIHVAPNYCKILLANAPSSAIDVIVQKNRVRGILKGAGQNGYMLHYVLKNADVAVGDMIVTAGIGGVFSSGIPAGTVQSVHRKERGMFLEIRVKPTVDFQRLEIVQINLSLQQSLAPGKIVP